MSQQDSTPNFESGSLIGWIVGLVIIIAGMAVAAVMLFSIFYNNIASY